MADCNHSWFARRGAWLRAILERIPDFAQLTALPLVNDEDPAMSGFMSPFDPETLKKNSKRLKPLTISSTLSEAAWGGLTCKLV
jgi:hypothetical protein